MTLRITVLRVKGAAPMVPLAAEFGDEGGAIGREVTNTLALPDPEKHLSRVQALVQCQGGEFLILDQGGNPTKINGHPLGKGNSCLLRSGDQIEMVEYLLGVELLRDEAFPAPQSAADPLGVLGSGLTPMLDPFALPQGAAPVAAEHAVTEVLSSSSGLPPTNDDPFAVFVVSSPASVVTPAAGSALGEDPFAAFGAPVPRPSAPLQPGPQNDDPLGIGLGQENNPASRDAASVDSLFNLGTSAKSDPFADSALADPALRPEAPVSGASLDPLALLMGSENARECSSPAVRDDASVLNAAFTPPKAEGGQELELEFEFHFPDSEEQVSGPVLAAEGDLSASPGLSPIPPQAEIFAPPLSEQVEPGVVVEPVKASEALASACSATATHAEEAALLAAFIKGLGVPGLQPPGGLTPEFMFRLGVVLREAVQGTMDLLVARAMTKREVRANVTMIVSKHNNPLKFSPDVGFALTQLLHAKAGTGGFMAPDEAMRDAYDDLRAHQLGFMAGMRAALAGVLARFKPEELETRLSDKSFLDSVLPANRKAKLWDLYEQRFSDISREAEDDFHSLFGREFLRAYEEQIQRLEAGQGKD